MKLLENVVFMDRVICLIKRSSTGDASNFAAKLGMSERNLHRLISDMREVGFPVKYNAEIRSYTFDEPVKYEFSLRVGDHDLLKIKGGQKVCLDVLPFHQHLP